MLTAAAIILGFIPGFAWLLFYLKEDLHPEPKKMIALVFVAGMISAVVALFLELWTNCAFSYSSEITRCVTHMDKGVELTLTLVFVFAVIEELCKFAAVYFTAARTKYFDEPVDAMVYMAVAALGFATVENLGALLQSLQTSDPFFNGMMETAIFRFVGTTLLHALTASVIGYFWALGIRSFKSPSFTGYGIFIASVLHAIFNYLILSYGNLFYSLAFVAVVGFLTLGDFDKLKDKNI